MEKKKSLKKNMLMSVILTMSNFVFPLITYGYVARTITPVGTGRVAFANSIIQYFSYIATLGVPAYGLRECAKLKNKKEELLQFIHELFYINIISTVISYVALIGTVLLIPKLYEFRLLFLVLSISIILNTIGMEWLYQAMEEYSYITIRSLIFKCVAVILTFILIRDVSDSIWYAFVSVFTVSASYICNFAKIAKILSVKYIFKMNGKRMKRHIKPILTLFSASIIIGIYANFDVSMIGFISTEYEVGLYNAASKIKSILLSLSTAITAVIIPRMSFYIQNGKKEDAYDLSTKSMRVSFLLAIPVAVYVFVYAEDVLEFICGLQYLSAVSILRILMICIVPLVLTNLFGNQILIPNGQEKRYSQSVFIGMWINLGLNFILIPCLGGVGAALGTLATEIWNLIWMACGVKEYVKNIKMRIKKFIGIYAGSMIISMFVCRMIISVFEISDHVLIKLFITAGVYFGLYYSMLLFVKEPLLVECVNKIKERFYRFLK